MVSKIPTLLNQHTSHKNKIVENINTQHEQDVQREIFKTEQTHGYVMRLDLANYHM
jgi:hypothetical protein